MNHLPLIIKREYLTKVRNKSFIIMTILSPIIMIILVTVVAYLSQLNNDTERTIAVLDESGLLANTFESNGNTKYDILENMTLEEAKAFSKDTGAFGLLHINDIPNLEIDNDNIVFYSNESPSLSLISDLENQLEKKFTNLTLLEKGVDINMIESSKAHVEISQENFEGQKTSKVDSWLKLAFGGAAGYLLFMFIIIYGNMIMRSVIEEKTSRIIEVIISSVKPIQLMLGKIIGTSLAGITQFIIWLILGFFMLLLASSILGIDMMQIQSPLNQGMGTGVDSVQYNDMIQDAFAAFFHLPLTNLIVAFILFFMAGYLLYSSLYAAIGAAVDNETDTQQFLLPIIMPLILAVYIGFFTVIEDPHGMISTIFSFIPLTSPVVMLMRIPFGVPIWQQLLSLIILILTFILVVWFAAKIYRVGILMYGKKPSYKEIVKWIKY